MHFVVVWNPQCKWHYGFETLIGDLMTCVLICVLLFLVNVHLYTGDSTCDPAIISIY